MATSKDGSLWNIGQFGPSPVGSFKDRIWVIQLTQFDATVMPFLQEFEVIHRQSAIAVRIQAFAEREWRRSAEKVGFWKQDMKVKVQQLPVMICPNNYQSDYVILCLVIDCKEAPARHSKTLQVSSWQNDLKFLPNSHIVRWNSSFNFWGCQVCQLATKCGSRKSKMS